jgi:hyperosmotically inducible protein
MKHTRYLMMAIFMAVATPGFAEKTTGQAIDDSVIQAEVKAKIMGDDFFGGMGANLETRKGVVQLGGWVEDPEQAAAFAKEAATVDGVVRVDNQLHKKTGERTLGQKADDVITTTRVKSAIAGADFGSGVSINIDTYHGTVLLTGFADNAAAKARAEELAGEDKNTTAVINGIYVLD